MPYLRCCYYYYYCFELAPTWWEGWRVSDLNQIDKQETRVSDIGRTGDEEANRQRCLQAPCNVLKLCQRYDLLQLCFSPFGSKQPGRSGELPYGRRRLGSAGLETNSKQDELDSLSD